jgi:hypothetical protein
VPDEGPVARPRPGFIRPLERDDLPQVASLYEAVSRSGSGPPPQGLASYFERTLLDHPWVDQEIPSLVYLDGQGAVKGFIGSHVRRLRLGGKPVRMACSGQLMSDPAVRNRAVGTLLLRRFFAGPQDLTMTDGATEATRRIWRGLGGAVGHLGSITWVRLVDWRAAGEQALQRFGMAAWRPVASPALWAVQAVANRVPVTSLRAKEPLTRAEDLTPELLLEHLPSVSQHWSLVPAYDEQFLAWLFHGMAEVRSRGELVKRLVRDREDRVLGWYVAYLQRRGLSQVMQVAARERDAPAVLDHLFHHAQRAGVAALAGQFEPSLAEALSQRRRRCFLHLSANFLVHARNPEVLNPILLGQAMITRMDGERWMGHHLEPFAP